MRGFVLISVFCLASCGGSSDSDGSGGKSGAGGSAGSATGGAAGSGQGGAFGGVSGGGSGGAAGSGGTGGAFPPPVVDDCITDVTASAQHVYQCSGLDWNVSVPAVCLTQACGLIFDVHGFSMSGQMEEANTQLKVLGASHGFIVVQPNADPAPPLAGWIAAEDDPKIIDFMQRTINAFHVDKKRVHFTGFSQGGDMTWRFLCAHADIIASAAPAAFGQSADEQCFSKGLPPVREIPILYMHGTKDNLVAFASAQASRDAVLSVMKMSEAGKVESDTNHIWTRYQNANGTVFEFIQHDYTGAALIGGHCYPGSTDPGGAPGQVFSFKCDQPAPFVWGEAVMAFFEAHPLP